MKNWNGKTANKEAPITRHRHGRKVDVKALIAKKRRKSAAFRAAYDGAREDIVLARQLIQLREKLGLSQRELAKRLGTSQAAISRLENPSYDGHTLSMLRRYARALGATVSIQFHQADR